ncbi:MAG: radical SAM protein, partial [Nanoarchaeota archaeon]
MIDELKRLNLELTSKCNYACAGCPTQELLRGKGTMKPELFKAILDETGNKLDRILLWGYGEPLFHPNISELIRYAGKFQTKKVMSTTGWKLEDIADLESLGQLDELIISINGLTQEIYAKHQINGD